MKLKPKNFLIVLLGSMIQAFGIRNIHAVAEITEGGALGLELLLNHWFNISPAVSGLIITALCYFIGWKTFGKNFLVLSFFSAGGYSVFYAIFERFQPVFPAIAGMPLVAAVAGAVFIGVGAGLCVRAGAATSGDDALAMSLSRRLNIDIRWIYLTSDLVVLALSLTYIPPIKIFYSLITVYLSGKIISLVASKKINLEFDK